MTLHDRRFFMKSLVVTAATASSAFAAWSRTAGGADRHGLGEATSATMLQARNQQLRFSGPGEPLHFQNFIREGNEWKAATIATPLIAGTSFSLITSTIHSEGGMVRCQGRGEGQGRDGKPLEYTWHSEVSAASGNSDTEPWIRFRTTLKLPSPLQLRAAGAVEPQIIVWLSSTSTLMEGQSGSWRRVLLGQPTRNSLGTAGNDLPAVYLLDQNAGAETMMFFDMDEMSWMSEENLPRFLVYRCSSVSQIAKDGTQRLGLGLIADQAPGNVLPQGDVTFTYYLLQRPAAKLISEQEAVARWMQATLPLFEEKLAWPACATSWKEFAAGTVQDLQNQEATSVEVEGHRGLMAYVKDSSKIWKEPPSNFELMTVSDVLWPSLLYSRLHPSAGFQAECDDLLTDLPAFYHASTHSISNSFRAHDDERADSWYPFENGLIKYPMIGAIAGITEVTSHFLDAFAQSEKFAHQYNYLFPIYYQVASLRAEGAGSNYSIGGLYAWSAILANKLTGESHYLDEARRAIQVLYTVPSDRLFHEPQELSFGALAAAELGMQEASKYLLYQQLRMFYWYSDPSQKTHEIRGMVQACASILYPAFKENVEAMLPWSAIMKRGIVFEGLLRFMDQQRRNNFYFFDDCSGDRQKAIMSFIPYENLGTLELAGQTGTVGKEIYGSGECLWMYLLFEALGRVADRELMLVNLDLLDVMSAKDFPSQIRNFILYNPTPAARSANIAIPDAAGKAVRWSADGKTTGDTLQVAGHSFVRLRAEF
jgi:hypothetical protein